MMKFTILFSLIGQFFVLPETMVMGKLGELDTQSQTNNMSSSTGEAELDVNNNPLAVVQEAQATTRKLASCGDFDCTSADLGCNAATSTCTVPVTSPQKGTDCTWTLNDNCAGFTINLNSLFSEYARFVATGAGSKPKAAAPAVPTTVNWGVAPTTGACMVVGAANEPRLQFAGAVKTIAELNTDVGNGIAGKAKVTATASECPEIPDLTKCGSFDCKGADLVNLGVCNLPTAATNPSTCSAPEQKGATCKWTTTANCDGYTITLAGFSDYARFIAQTGVTGTIVDWTTAPTSGACFVTKSETVPAIQVKSTAVTSWTAVEKTVADAGGKLTTQESDCPTSFAISRFGGLGLGLLMSVIGVLLF